MKSPSARRPVFLDATGRRHRTIRRAGAVLAVPVVGYLVLMASSMLGGPRLDTPLVPLPEAVTKPEHRPKTTPGPAAIQTLEPTPTPRSSELSRTPTSTPSTRTPSITPTVGPTTVAPSTPTNSSPTTPPGNKPTTAHASNKPTVPPGRTKSPSKP